MKRIWLWIVTILLVLLAFFGGRSTAHWQAAGHGQRLAAMMCYDAQWLPIDNKHDYGAKVALKDQFDDKPVNTTVEHLRYICTPTKKEVPPGFIPTPTKFGDHLRCYVLDPKAAAPQGQWIFDDQFGSMTVTIYSGSYFCDPADKQYVKKIEP